MTVRVQKPNSSNLTEPARFLQMLYGDDPPGYLVLWTAQDHRTICGSASHWEGAGQKAETLAQHKDVYFGIGLHGQKLDRYHKGEAKGVIAIPGLWIDLDVKGPSHKEPNLPANLEEAMELLGEFPLDPTVVIHSGHGLQVWWLFNELWVFDDDKEHQEAATLARAFQATLRGRAQERGWKLDNTSNLDRILRLPGTYNRKLEPVPVRILECDEERRYNPDDFEPVLVDIEALDRASEQPSAGTSRSETEYPPAGVDKVLEGCAWLKHCHDDAATLSEPEWYAMLSIVGRCKDGEALAHEWSGAYSGYTAAETDAKLQQALETAGPRTCADIRLLAGDSYCADCQHWAKIKSPITLGQRKSGTDRPRIDAGSGDLAGIADQAWQALQAANEPPHLFQRGGLMTRIQLGDSGEPYLSVMTEAGLRGVLARCAWWYRWAGKEDSRHPVDALPPLHVVKDMMAAPEMPLPIISRLVEAPVFGREGQLELSPGYHGSSRTYFWDHGIRVPIVSESPSDREVNQARRLLVDELLGDFPFTSQTELAHAMAALLGPFIREMIQGPTPMHMIEAPSPGTGKSLLADAISIPATGRPAATMTEGRDEDEWRKRITAALVAAPTYLLIDNVRRKLDSAALSAALTSQVWQDRILGRSELTKLPVRAMWLATANNPALTTEMARRTVRIRMDAKVARPWQRDDFRHKDLRTWAVANRGDLVWAALTLVQAWVTDGMKPGDYTLGQYESWARVIGGVLDCAGVKGFLGNLDEVYSVADEETAQWEAFLDVWWTEHQDYPQSMRELFRIAEDRDLLLTVRGDKSEQSQKIRMGKAMAQQRDRQIGRFRIEQAGKDGKNKTALYQLVPVEDVKMVNKSVPPVEVDDDEPF